MSNPETDIQNKILLALSKEFHKHGGVFWRQNAGKIRSHTGAWVQLGPVGISDIVGVVFGKVFFFEVKTKTGRQRKAQAAFENAITKAGGVYAVVRSAEEAVAVVNQHAIRDDTLHK
ncbi:VRR-NUC domain-containing protein [Roseinatronobacter sp.]|uniref:VRR-NUC domain-containing protein n=1 Tax=Roseinatronobacter sp. TaxID=1945755 RepID=UPI0025CF8F24|nr:VRR-NUC domain-containing protein [Roseibaca sp.]